MNHSALLASPTLIPIIIPPIIVIDKPVRSGGKLSAYALTNSPEYTIDPNAAATWLKGGNAMLMSDRPANSQIKNTRKKEAKRQKRRFTLIANFPELNAKFSLPDEIFCESDKTLDSSQNKTVAEYTATVRIYLY